jgi:hypothetical protein
MQQLLVNIKDNSKIDLLLNFLRSLNYISVEKINEASIFLSDEQKNVLNQRRKTSSA